jgi:hypothetical protein
VLLGTFGSSALGASLLRRDFRPRATAWLLTLSLPLFVLLSTVSSLGTGIVPLVLAWAFAGHRLAANAATRPTPAQERITAL